MGYLLYRQAFLLYIKSPWDQICIYIYPKSTYSNTPSGKKDYRLIWISDKFSGFMMNGGKRVFQCGADKEQAVQDQPHKTNKTNEPTNWNILCQSSENSTYSVWHMHENHVHCSYQNEIKCPLLYGVFLLSFSSSLSQSWLLQCSENSHTSEQLDEEEE